MTYSRVLPRQIRTQVVSVQKADMLFLASAAATSTVQVAIVKEGMKWSGYAFSD